MYRKGEYRVTDLNHCTSVDRRSLRPYSSSEMTLVNLRDQFLTLKRETFLFHFVYDTLLVVRDRRSHVSNPHFPVFLTQVIDVVTCTYLHSDLIEKQYLLSMLRMKLLS